MCVYICHGAWRCAHDDHASFRVVHHDLVDSIVSISCVCPSGTVLTNARGIPSSTSACSKSRGGASHRSSACASHVHACVSIAIPSNAPHLHSVYAIPYLLSSRQYVPLIHQVPQCIPKLCRAPTSRATHTAPCGSICCKLRCHLGS